MVEEMLARELLAGAGESLVGEMLVGELLPEGSRILAGTRFNNCWTFSMRGVSPASSWLDKTPCSRCAAAFFIFILRLSL